VNTQGEQRTLPANTSRADYEPLAQIATRFGLEAQQTAATTQNLQKAMQSLQQGDWLGAGAQAFFAEMNSAVLPSLARLVTALQSAQRTTLAIRSEFQVAEAEAKIILTPNESIEQQTPIPAFATSPATPAPMAVPAPTPATPATTPIPPTSDVANGNTSPQQIGPFHIGPPQRPPITHDNGFSDPALHEDPGFSDYAQLAKWKVMLEGSEAFRHDLVDANAAYRHFLEGDGQDRTFSYERYVESDSSGKTTLNNSIIDAHPMQRN
jgi:WXG100 family type VII secretion target